MQKSAVLFAITLTGLALNRCGPATCTAGDDACILSHLQLNDSNGHSLPLTMVPGSAVSPLTRTGPGGTAGSGTAASSQPSGGSGASASAVPSVTGLPGSLVFLDYYNIYTLTVTFTDVCGERPGGCFGVHHGPSRVPSDAWYATPPVNDGATAGQWVFQMSFDYNSPTTDNFTIDFVAWSNCGTDPNSIQALVSGNDVAMGQLVEISAQVDAEGSSSSSSGGGSLTCPSPTVADPLGSGGCCTTGICPNSCSDGNSSWYEVAGREYGPCSVGNNSCLQSAAAAAATACGYGR